ELPQRIDVAVGHFVFGEDVVIGNDDDFAFVPDLGVLAEVLFEDTDGAGAAYIVGHEDIRIDPDVVARPDLFLTGIAVPGLHRHWTHIESLSADVAKGS